MFYVNAGHDLPAAACLLALQNQSCSLPHLLESQNTFLKNLFSFDVVAMADCAPKARRSRMAHPESGQTCLSDKWACVLSWLVEVGPITSWQLWAIYGEDVEHDCATLMGADLLNRISAAQKVTFSHGRHLGQEPCGLELFGPLVGQGYDPGLTDAHKEICAEFVRNLDNWVSLAHCHAC